MEGNFTPGGGGLAVRKVTAQVFRAPIARPVRTSFGTMTDRPAVVVRVEDEDGTPGFGEAWCNFPAVGAEHRARLIESFLAPLATGREWAGPREVFAHLTERARPLAVQSGEPGPLAQAIAGVDIALWDAAARREGSPLWKFLGGSDGGEVACYASGLGPEEPLMLAEEAREAGGFGAFKLKVGFGWETDQANLRQLREGLGPEAVIAADANGAWSAEEAVRMSRRLAGFGVAWLEEPIPADSPPEDWRRLAEESPLLLAGGENLRGEAEFAAALETGALDIVQPDITKWGGFSGGLPLARRILAAGKRFYPHFLGGGIGLLASAHLLAATGGGGLLELDANPNPLREALARPFPKITDGQINLPKTSGLGSTPDTSAVKHLGSPVLSHPAE